MAAMKVFVTGGTGFVGACITAELVRAGHDVRLLVRRPDQVPVSLAPYDVTVGDLVVGDVLDEEVVRKALDGCDSVVHAAAVFSFKPNRARQMLDTNVRAAEVVLGQAVEAGLDPVVHISSSVALTRKDGSGPDLPLGDVDAPYSRSKTASEAVARRLQDDGAPVVSVYPGSVYGPHDPYRGEQSERLRWLLRGLFPMWAPGKIHTVDVRTVAATVLAVLEPGRGARRYVVPGQPIDGRTVYRTVSTVTGRRLPGVVPPLGLTLPLTRALGWMQMPLPDHWHYPADAEAVQVSSRATVLDDSPARRELGIDPVPFEQSMRDTIVSLVESGRLRPRYAGKALEAQG